MNPNQEVPGEVFEVEPTEVIPGSVAGGGVEFSALHGAKRTLAPQDLGPLPTRPGEVATSEHIAIDQAQWQTVTTGWSGKALHLQSVFGQRNAAMITGVDNSKTVGR